ncbi:hypothetical protein [uncultured Dokdonia sp.]|uniref:hypothetical protein n=1 Tax=uncultured Dokdonia sp. TaxID=575653 RepID=UPI002613FBF3|nr:hypothetical protein [uncultured Dokdonia sp.]
MTSNVEANPPFKLSETAYNELIEVLRDEIGQDSIDRLGEDNIHHIGHHLLTLTAIQLRIRIKEYKQGNVDNLR